MASGPPPPAPVDVVVARWATDPDFATAYTYLRPGGTPADRAALAEPVAPGLVFAGEATSVEHPGTMHGAWFSGEGAARRLCAERAPRRVLVIGAGCAGIAAARSLRATGVDVTILEAKPMPGGRARTDRSLGGPSHLGAAWLHGDRGHPIAAIARELGLRVDPSRWQQTVTFVEGVGRLPDESARRIGVATSAVWADLDRAEARASVDESLGPILARTIDVHRAGLSPIEQLVVERSITGIYENLYAAPVDDLSMRHREEPFRLPGDDLTVLDGLDRVIEHACAGLDVRLATRVDRVTVDGQGWRVEARDIDSGEATTERADAVIVTVPVSVVRSTRIGFDPPLPARFTDALGRIGAGVVTKAFFAFEEPFWAPLWSFSTIGTRRFDLELWVDVSAAVGRPTLCGFATGERAATIETMERDALLRLAHDTLTVAGVGVSPPPSPVL
jgi:monoamine oxidase